MEVNKICYADCLDILLTVKDKNIDCVIRNLLYFKTAQLRIAEAEADER